MYAFPPAIAGVLSLFSWDQAINDAPVLNLQCGSGGQLTPTFLVQRVEDPVFPSSLCADADVLMSKAAYDCDSHPLHHHIEPPPLSAYADSVRITNCRILAVLHFA